MSNLVEGATGRWEVVIGLEVHAQVISQSKLFSGAATAFGAAANSQVSLVDAGMPGMLPVINEVAVEQAVRSGLGLNAKINTYSVFDRKNYFYADLPQGYQISQYLQPIVGEGVITVDLEDGSSRDIGVERLHLEQDAGKSIHDRHPTKTHVDLNRSGVALMEIVSKPDMRSAEEAGAYVRKVRAILRYLGTCDGNMEEGSMRADVNVSVRHPGDELGTRAEIKNVNSIRFMQQAIHYETSRQIDILEDGGSIDQETRLFDSQTGTTRPMRSKEEAHDYRYFPDPDLLPLEFSDEFVDGIRATLPELPDAKKKRYMAELGLSEHDAQVLVSERDIAVFFEEVATGREAKVAANWVQGDFFALLGKAELEVADSPISAAQLGGLIDLITDGTISGKIAKDVLETMFESGQDASVIVEEKGLKQVSDTGAIEGEIDKVIAANADKVAEFRGGKDKVLGWFVGQIMQATKGKANPQMVNQLLREKLKP
ncbi:MAG: Asp-tRNA(Asn)/Glu-tRNA(Gln) amidotransferase subunit GatB [Rhodospirillaceae bacterium]|nr:Asp-tRNA(Asn)/Glu-tRNA(Gln) amidotransferase subunit GatB [Rhodospirillaceae bacterium]MBT5523521.1 Asp-tRNA(Asn)/Glu-tRNA(Gln) amidotransferase subunit GatB [Rhodospirillaceae bacterium]MBT5880504.1 Asp-tRNA(Asn)/Glu-tRNA(Gln) amidotransferase subunit GatB [Rhodospirillaceae bacterium]MBT6591234.1 Asp-tRNA(Asn)/Glu-tRNA(Gln) amidotransferase subunit GatB [Rhodospirillaceae bacterium]MBT7285979.1 Asp-tRNA(Asn)/Glu-tRNA(Gln) amidotransferase subunit GatB [Rhodospirillaceae bacterium]